MPIKALARLGDLFEQTDVETELAWQRDRESTTSLPPAEGRASRSRRPNRGTSSVTEADSRRPLVVSL